MFYIEEECQKIYEQGFRDCWNMGDIDTDAIIAGKIPFPLFPKKNIYIQCAKNTEQQVQTNKGEKN